MEGDFECYIFDSTTLISHLRPAPHPCQGFYQWIMNGVYSTRFVPRFTIPKSSLVLSHRRPSNVRAYPSVDYLVICLFLLVKCMSWGEILLFIPIVLSTTDLPHTPRRSTRTPISSFQRDSSVVSIEDQSRSPPSRTYFWVAFFSWTSSLSFSVQSDGVSSVPLTSSFFDLFVSPVCSPRKYHSEPKIKFTLPFRNFPKLVPLLY